MIDSNLENYTGTLEVIISSNIGFYLTHFFINVITIFVLEIRDSRCRSAGAMSGILGHDLQGFQTEKTREPPMWDKRPKSNLLLKGRDHGYAHARRLSLQNKFVGSTLNSKSPLPVQSLKILRFIRTSVALAGLVILR